MKHSVNTIAETVGLEVSEVLDALFAQGAQVNHYNTPMEDAAEGIDREQADSICHEDPSLVYIECQDPTDYFPAPDMDEDPIVLNTDEASWGVGAPESIAAAERMAADIREKFGVEVECRQVVQSQYGERDDIRSWVSANWAEYVG